MYNLYIQIYQMTFLPILSVNKLVYIQHKEYRIIHYSINIFELQPIKILKT